MNPNLEQFRAAIALIPQTGNPFCNCPETLMPDGSRRVGAFHDCAYSIARNNLVPSVHGRVVSRLRCAGVEDTNANGYKYTREFVREMDREVVVKGLLL